MFFIRNMSALKQNTLSNLFWRYAERICAHIVTVVVQIVLARILSPDDFGIVALILVFTTILESFVDSGLGNALIQKKDADNTDFSTVFFTNVFISLFLYFLIFLGAPVISDFYGKTELTSLIRVLSLSIIICAVKNVQQAYVSRNLIFRKFFVATISGTIFSAIIGIYLAENGYGVWAIVFQMLTNLTVDTFLLWVIVKWRPKLEFSYNRLKTLFSYGWKLLASTLLDKGYNNLRQLIIGKVYMPEDLAFYNRGEMFPLAVVSNINTSIDSVIFPVMSRVQDNIGELKNITRRSIKTSIYIMAPLMIGISVCAEHIISLLLTDKWIHCVPYMRIFCITYMFWPMHTANLNAIKALGKSNVFLRLEIYKKIIGILLLLITMWHSVMAMAYSLLVSCITSQMINAYPNKKLLNYGYKEQIKDFLPEIILSMAMGGIIFLFNFLDLNICMILCMQLFVGLIFYIVVSKLLKLESYIFLTSELKSVINLKWKQKNE